MVVIIDDKDVENLVLRGIGVPIFFILGKGDLHLSLKNCVEWEFPMVAEHEDSWSNKKGFWKPPKLAFLIFLIFLGIFKKVACRGTFLNIYSANSF